MQKIYAIAGAASLLLAVGANAQDAKLMSADKADPAMKVDTADFAKAVMASDHFEMESSAMAEKRAKDPAIKTFAAEMIKDHEKSEKDLKAAMGGKASSSASVSPKQAKMLEQLKAAKDADFEPLYVDMQVHSHMEAVALFRTYSGNGEDAKVKAFATKTRPVVEMHLDMAQKIAASE